MKIALLIHAHTKPHQVDRLVSRLIHKDVDIYINVDAKAPIDAFKNIEKDVTFIKNRVEVKWGRFSQVQQILNSFEEIVNTATAYSHILFISGQDYPVQPISQIVSFLDKNQGNSFIDYHKLGNDAWSNTIKKRYEYWHFLPEQDIRNNSLIKKILLKIGFKRSYPFDDIYYGSCWFCLNTEIVQYLLKYTKDNPKTVNFFRHSGCSDELYIQSVLVNSPLKSKLTNEIYRYFDWSDEGKSPKILTIEDLPKIQKSQAWFARKLDLDTSPQLFDSLDKLNA